MTVYYGPLANVQVLTNAGAPSDGPTGTGAGGADPGALLIDTTNFNVYINAGTKASPVWAVVSLSALSAAELGVIDTVTPGTAKASKAVVLDAAKHVDEVNTASLKLGATGATVAVTATAAQLNTLAGASAGIAAVLAGGLGGSVAQAKTANGVTEIVAAHGTKDRAVLVVVVVTETFADGDGTQPTFQIGEADTADKFFAAAAFTGAAAGTVLVAGGTNLATKNLRVTAATATGTTSTGALAVTAIAIPTS